MDRAGTGRAEPGREAAVGAYLGPAGTFTELAAQRVRSVSASSLIAAPDAHDIAVGVEDGRYDFGVVPIENSVHGTVLPTLDELVFERESVLIREEVVVDVAFTLYEHRDVKATQGTATASGRPPRVVLSHPHALAQCRDVIAARGLVAVDVASTAEACRLVASERPDAMCIAGPTAGDGYGLVAVAEGVQDRDGGRTRFYVLARSLAVRGARHTDVADTTTPADQASARTVDEFRTALVLTPARDRPGILLEMLRPFAERGLNLSSLMSRPLRSGLGVYCFIVVVDAHIDTPRFGPALSELLDNGVRIKNLGSYLAWPSNTVAVGAHREYPAGSVGAVDPPEAHARILAPPYDGIAKPNVNRDIHDARDSEP